MAAPAGEVAHAPMTDLSEDSLGTRLRELIAAGIIEEIEGPDGTTLYGLTDPGRQTAGVLMSATRWERTHRPEESGPVGVSEADTFLRMPLPLVRLPESINGLCTMTMALDPVPGAPRSLTVWAQLRRGRVVVHSAQPLRRPPSASAHGSVDDWLDALLDGAVDRLQIRGRRELAVALIRGIGDRLPSREARREDERLPVQPPGRPTPRTRTRGPTPARRRAGRRHDRLAGTLALELLQEIGGDGTAILRHLDDHPADDSNEIACKLGIDIHEVNRHLDRLEETGLTRPVPPRET